MHPDFRKADALSKQVIGAAIEVHKLKGPGLLESIYERCVMRELELKGIRATNQLAVPVEYKGLVFETPLRLDLFVESCLIIEIKATETVQPIHKAQLLSYMKLLNAPLGLILNFHEVRMANGIHRMILQGADQP